MAHHLSVALLATPLAICRLRAGDPVPSWTASARHLLMIARTPAELSVVADAAAVPHDVDAVRGYRALRVEGPLPLDLVGILAALAVPLAAAGVPIFPIATYDTDYILVPEHLVARAVGALSDAGHRVVVE